MLRRVSCAAIGVVCWSAIAAAQAGRQYSAADYARAERWMDYNVDPLVYHTVKDPVWLADGRFWYRDLGPDGMTYMLVDPSRKKKAPAVDQA